VVEGAKWVGGKVSEGARWVGGKVVAAGEWVFDQIKSLIESGTNWLSEKWENIQAFGRSSFEDIKNGFGSLIHFITTPLSNFMSALSEMEADQLRAVWNSLLGGSNALWTGINSVIASVSQVGTGIWNTVSGYIKSVLDNVNRLFNNVAFNLLPDWMKREARSIFNRLQSLWNQVSSFWTDLWQRLTSTIQEILAAVRSFIDNIIGFGIDAVTGRPAEVIVLLVQNDLGVTWHHCRERGAVPGGLAVDEVGDDDVPAGGGEPPSSPSRPPDGHRIAPRAPGR
jgi:phage-related protein